MDSDRPKQFGYELPDFTDVDLRELFATDDSNVAEAIQRLVETIDGEDGVISAFQSFAAGT